MSARATRDVVRYFDAPGRLAPAIQLTIGAATRHGLLLAAFINEGQIVLSRDLDRRAVCTPIAV